MHLLALPQIVSAPALMRTEHVQYSSVFHCLFPGVESQPPLAASDETQATRKGVIHQSSSHAGIHSSFSCHYAPIQSRTTFLRLYVQLDGLLPTNETYRCVAKYSEMPL